MTQGLGWYLDTIGRVPLLTAAEEIELGTAVRQWLDHPAGPDHAPPAIRRRGRRAKDRFVSANLRLVVRYCSGRARSQPSVAERLEDAIQEGSQGLIRAVEKFDPTRGYKFSTYATYWVWQAVNSWLDQSDLIRHKGNHNQHLCRLLRAGEEYQSRHGRPAARHELAAITRLSEQRIDELLEYNRQTVSLDTIIGDGDCLADFIAATGPAEPDAALAELREAMARLPPLAQQVLALRFGFNGDALSLVATAATLGISVGTVQQIEAQALAQLRQPQQRSEPERFAERVVRQLELPCPSVVLITGRRQTRRRGGQRQLHLQRRDAPEGAVEQLAMLVPLSQQEVGVAAEFIDAG